MLVSSSAPPVRIPAILREPDNRVDPKQAARYFDHDSWGVGLSPLSAQAEIPHSPRLSTVIQVTSGVAWFSNVVPYGQATQANFTVSPGASLQWQASTRTRIAFGYTLHHVSNASIGGSNPGMNSHIFYTRLTALKLR
jgi:Lipid A 3-O-deacylase (PagL)